MIEQLLFWLIILVVTAIPLHLVVTLLGGDSSILKVLLVNFLVLAVNFYITQTFHTYAGLFSFLALFLIYKYMFRLGWIATFLVWILQVVVGLILVAILLTFGFSLLF